MPEFPSINEISAKAKANRKANRKLFDKIRKKKPKRLDEVCHELHEEAFEKINCLDCANCCKTISPIFLGRDIDRIAKFLGIKSDELIHSYLLLDEEGDYVYKKPPCPFLASNNQCLIYEVRPKACKDYPHTDRKQIHKFLDVTYKNIAVCPAVYYIIERLKANEHWLK